MSRQKRASFVSALPWVFYAIALLIMFYLMRAGNSFLWSYLRAVVLMNGGVQGLWAATGHLVYPEQTAKKIGWKSSGFQTEMGFTNLALGITGVISFFYDTWVIPVALTVAIIFAGCAYVHIKDRVTNRNNAPCNSGSMLYNTILVSLTLFLALLLL